MTSEHAGDDGLRIGDGERMSAVEELSRHFAAGRLDQQEFDERSQAVYEARTRADLRPLFADLPSSEPGSAPAGVPAGSREVAGRDGDGVRDESGGEVERRSDRIKAVVMGVTPPIALVLFFVLMAAGVELAWLVFLAVPVVGTVLYGPERRDRIERRRRRGLE